MKRFLILTLFIISSLNSYGGDFAKFFPNVIKVEGHTFVQVAFDRGGATKLGITFQTFIMFCNLPKVPVQCDKNKDSRLTASDMFFLKLEDVKPIYKNHYWDVVKADSIKNQALAEFIADFVVNSGGSGRSIRLLQKVIGTKADGHFGTKTVAKINSQNPLKLFNKLYKFRRNYYYSLARVRPSQKRFLNGWFNRISNLKNIYKNENYI